MSDRFGPPPAFPGFDDVDALAAWIGNIRSRAFFAGARHDGIDRAEALAMVAASSKPDAAPMQHIAYFDEGAFHWMSGIAPRDCELYAPHITATGAA